MIKLLHISWLCKQVTICLQVCQIHLMSVLPSGQKRKKKLVKADWSHSFVKNKHLPIIENTRWITSITYLTISKKKCSSHCSLKKIILICSPKLQLFPNPNTHGSMNGHIFMAVFNNVYQKNMVHIFLCDTKWVRRYHFTKWLIFIFQKNWAELCDMNVVAQTGARFTPQILVLVLSVNTGYSTTFCMKRM